MDHACRELTQPCFCCGRNGSPLTGTPRREQLEARTQGEQCHLKGSFVRTEQGGVSASKYLLSGP